jgi:hypothetical protein
MKSKRQYYTINEVCKMFGFKCPEHIKTNPDLTRLNGGQYDIVRGSKHDGTLIFTIELLERVIKPLINKESYFKEMEIEFELAKDVTYEVGLISVATIYGMVDLPIGRCHGQRQRARLPVKCTIIH